MVYSFQTKCMVSDCAMHFVMSIMITAISSNVKDALEYILIIILKFILIFIQLIF